MGGPGSGLRFLPNLRNQGGPAFGPDNYIMGRLNSRSSGETMPRRSDVAPAFRSALTGGEPANLGTPNDLGREIHWRNQSRSYPNCSACTGPRGGATVALAAPAFGQTKTDAKTDTAGDEPIQDVVVTGSRIAAPNMVATSPIQVTTSQDIKIAGKTDISDIILVQMPRSWTQAWARIWAIAPAD